MIGRAIAQRAVGFGMNVVAVDVNAMTDVPYVSEVWAIDRLHDLMAQSDVVALAVARQRSRITCSTPQRSPR